MFRRNRLTKIDPKTQGSLAHPLGILAAEATVQSPYAEGLRQRARTLAQLLDLPQGQEAVDGPSREILRRGRDNTRGLVP